MPPRLGHSKSRHGCARCKQRRVKCDEIAPCQNCVRRNEDCSLLRDQTTNLRPSLGAQVHLLSPGVTDSNFLSHLVTEPSLENQPSETTWGEDLFLMSHFTSSTTRTISSQTEVLQLWQDVIPEEAITCPFLVHGMLALSAMHLASLRPSQRGKYEQCCRQHQIKAISGYRRAIQNIKPEAGGQVFAMASLVVLFSLATISDNALPKEDTSSKNHPTFTDVISIFAVVRGVKAILEPGTSMWHTIISSRYKVAITGHTTTDGQNSDLPANVELRYRQLMTDCLDSLLTDDKSAKQNCLEAIDWLRSIHRELLFLVSKHRSHQEVDLEPGYLVKWFALVSPQFVAMLRQGNAAALVILGDFFALLRLLENRWFLKNASTNGLNAIREVIDPRGLEWLSVLHN